MYQRQSSDPKDDTLIIAPPYAHVNDPSKLANTRDKRDKLLRLTLLIQIRESIRGILDLQLRYEDRPVNDFTPPWAKHQAELRTLYTTFVKKFGAINMISEQGTGVLNSNGDQGMAHIRVNLREFREDPDCALVCSIEEFDDNTLEYRPTEIFDKRVLKPYLTETQFSSVEEALAFCAYEKGVVDFDYIARLTQGAKGADEVMKALQSRGLIFHDPAQKRWVQRQEYLSGNVRAKLREALDASATDDSYAHNAEALRSVSPEEIKQEEMDISLGMHFLPTDIVARFAEEILGYKDVSAHYIDLRHAWFVNGVKTDYQRANHEYGTLTYDAMALLRYALQGQKPIVHAKKRHAANDEDEDEGDEESVDENHDAAMQTQSANDKVEKIKTAFQDWLWRDEARAERVVNLYNDTFNALVKREYEDVVKLALPGASVSITPREHQLRAVVRNVTEGNVLHLHAVGAGKTFSSIMTVMEMKRMQKINKPLFVVPNHMLHQFSRDFMRLYPGAHILTLDEDQFRDEDGMMTGVKKLRSFAERSAAHPWDAVFITQSNFDRLRLKPEALLRQKLDEIDLIEDRLQQVEINNTAGRRMLEKARRDIRRDIIQSLGVRSQMPGTTLNEDQIWDEVTKGDDGYLYTAFWQPWLSRMETADEAFFEDLGTDYLVVDEAQDYKNRSIDSHIEGLSQLGSARAENLAQILSYLRSKNPDYFASFLTATPIANALAELFFMQLYLRPGLYEDIGIRHFDAWHAMFAHKAEMVEMAPEGNRFRTIERYAEYKNVPELLRIFHKFTDIVHEEDLHLDLPELKDGKPGIITVPRPETLADFFDNLCVRADSVRDGLVSPKEDNMLKITSAGRLASVHPSLVGLTLAEGEKSKIDYLAEEVAQRYFANQDNIYHTNGEPDAVKGAMQMIFSDVGVPKGEGQFSVYEDIKDKLIGMGIPRDKIKFVHDYKSNRQKAALREECAKGHVAVLIGTTAKLGTGTNVQKRLIAQHHLDAPWRPADLIQRIGRIIRTGNQNKTVEVLRYVMEGSFDQYMWQTLERKVRFILQIVRGDKISRRAEEVDKIIVPYVEAKKAATGSDQPLLLEKIELENRLRKLIGSRRAHEHEQHRARFEIKRINDSVASLNDRIGLIRDTMTHVAQHKATQDVPLILNGHTLASEAEAEDALRAVLRDFRKTLKKNDLHKMEAEIGQYRGYPLYVTAIRHQKKEETEAVSDDATPEEKPKRYQFILRLGDPLATTLVFYKKDIKKRGKDAEADDAEDAFNDVSGVVEEVHNDDPLLQRLAQGFDDFAIALQEANAEMTACKTSLETLESAVQLPFDYESEYQEVQARLVQVDRALLKQTDQGFKPEKLKIA